MPQIYAKNKYLHYLETWFPLKSQNIKKKPNLTTIFIGIKIILKSLTDL